MAHLIIQSRIIQSRIIQSPPKGIIDLAQHTAAICKNRFHHGFPARTRHKKYFGAQGPAT
jgi:hypothetical protein